MADLNHTTTAIDQSTDYTLSRGSDGNVDALSDSYGVYTLSRGSRSNTKSPQEEGVTVVNHLTQIIEAAPLPSGSFDRQRLRKTYPVGRPRARRGNFQEG